MDITTRPRPILAKVKSVGGAVAALGGLVTWAGSFGLLSVQQTAASSALLGLVPGTFAAVVALLASFGVARAAEPLVTPMADPRNDEGTALVSVAEPELIEGLLTQGWTVTREANPDAPQRFRLRDDRSGTVVPDQD